MRNFLLLSFVFFFYCCTNSVDTGNKRNNSVDAKAEVKPRCVIVEKWRLESINADSVRLDGIQMPTNKDEIVKKFGQPSQIKKVSKERSFMLPKDGEAYEWEYGGTVFDLIDGKLTLKILDFSSTDVTLVIDSLTLRKGMSAADICKLFPESCKLLIPDGGNMWSGQLALRAGMNNPYRRWILVFHAEKLAKVYCRLTF